jgi:hypothetical protein
MLMTMFRRLLGFPVVLFFFVFAVKAQRKESTWETGVWSQLLEGEEFTVE